MKLILNKAGQGNAELKKLIGFLDRSILFENLERFIIAATQEIILLIGKTTYDVIQDYYENDSADATELERIGALQYSIAIQAYRQYVPSKDVGHTQNGRRMRLDEHEKQAFEWMIDRDNENMERMYYQSLDQLLIVLDEMLSFKLTDQYKKLNSLFVSTTADFEEFFNIKSSRLLLMKLQPGLRQCERQAIIPRLGKIETAALKADLTTDETLTALVKEACVYWSLSWALRGRLTVTLFPEGVLQRFVGERTTTQGKQPAQFNEYAWAAQEFKKDADHLLLRIEEYLAPPIVPVPGEAIDVTPSNQFDDDDIFIST